MSDDTLPQRPKPQPTGITAVLSAILASNPASAVVPVVPADTLDGIIERVRAARASSVQLLVPEGVPALRGRRSFAALRLILQRDGISILVISPDASVLEAARAGGLETMAVGDSSPPRPTTAAPAAPPSTQPVIDKRDAEFLRALDNVPARERFAELSDSDAAFAASLDDLSEAIAAASSPPAEQTAPPPAPKPSRRVSAADIRLSPEEERRAAAYETGRPSEAPPRRTAAPHRTPAPRDARRTARRTAAPTRIGDHTMIIGVAIAVLVVALLIAFGWYQTNRVSIIVGPPVVQSRSQPFRDEIIPITTADPGPNPSSIQAAVVQASASFTVQGQVTSETLTPVGRATGQVRIINVVEQPFPLPEGTELLGRNSDGAEVRFAIEGPVTVPPAVTTTSDRGRSTTYGEIVVTVVARSPGSASNVGANALTQLLIPGMQPIVSDRGNLLIRHEAIGGGTEQMQRIVTEADVQRVLGEALTGLYNAGMQQLVRQIDQNILAIDPTTIFPSSIDLAQPDAYDPPLIEPPIGQPVDPANPVFRLTVSTRFSALATPRERLVNKQLEVVVPQHFLQRGTRCNANERVGFDVAGWRWDGSKLTINGAVTCTEYGVLTSDTLNQIRRALVGVSRSDAETILKRFEQQGLISNYTLPAIQTLPGFDFLIDVRPTSASS
ncbi:MAG: hypothetical protein NZ699_05130 [Roseiflexus sp.]|nr:hypothetical protein [Roseiflexus sp.]MCS7288498.1 hypothetical protein [Roseiflexus sp.]MDW8231345.1 hypothetical protein [Roseiflexaceae bacterium]